LEATSSTARAAEFVSNLLGRNAVGETFVSALEQNALAIDVRAPPDQT